MVKKSFSNVNVKFVSQNITTFAGAITLLKILCDHKYLHHLPHEDDRSQGWLDGQMVLAVMLLNVHGLDRVADIDKLEEDRALCTLVRQLEPQLYGRRRSRLNRRHRGGRDRLFPSARSLLDWLSRFHDEAADVERQYGTSYIPEPSSSFTPLRHVWQRLLHDLISYLDLQHLTLDLDATIIASGKASCLRTYRAATGEVPHERGYQPIVAYCKELGMIIHCEMRDGNVAAKTDIQRFLEETLELLPSRVSSVSVRMDGAGYQMDVISYCNRPSLRPLSLHRFGKIGFVISAPLYPEARDTIIRTPSSAWSEMAEDYGKGAEINHVPTNVAKMKTDERVRYVAYRRRVAGFGVGENEVPVHQMGCGSAYRLRLLVTNHPAPGEQYPADDGLEEIGLRGLLSASNDRCGRSEHAHGEIKSDFAGGMMPSSSFGSNSCWFMLACLSYNLVAHFRHRATEGGDLLRCRMKRLRTLFFHTSGKLVKHANSYTLKITRNRELERAWDKLHQQVPIPP